MGKYLSRACSTSSLQSGPASSLPLGGRAPSPCSICSPPVTSASAPPLRRLVLADPASSASNSDKIRGPMLPEHATNSWQKVCLCKSEVKTTLRYGSLRLPAQRVMISPTGANFVVVDGPSHHQNSQRWLLYSAALPLVAPLPKNGTTSIVPQGNDWTMFHLPSPDMTAFTTLCPGKNRSYFWCGRVASQPEFSATSGAVPSHRRPT